MTVFSRLFRLFIFVIITPLFVTGVFLFYYQNHNKTEILTNYLNIAQISAKFIAQDIETVAQRFDFVNDITPLLDKNKKKVESVLDESVLSNPDFVFMAILNSSGEEIVRSANKEVSALMPKVDLSSDVSIKDISINNIALSGLDQKLPFPFIEIVYPTKDGKYLFAVVNLFSIWDKLTSQNIGSTGGIYFANINDGLLDFDRRPVPDISATVLKDALESDSHLIKNIESSDGSAFVGAFTRTVVPGTYMLVMQYKKEAYYTINLITWLIAFFILATTTLSYFAALSFSQEISEPIEKLTAAAQKISDSDFDVSLEADNAWGEFEILINTFNAMAARLSQYQAVQLDKLLDEKKKTDLLAGLMRDGVAMCTLEGNELFSNNTAAKILESDALCRNVECTIHGQIQKPLLKDLISVPNGTIFSYDCDGKPAYFEMLVEVFRPVKEEAVAIIIFRDITSEHEVSEMKNDIFNSVAHDLRAPLLGLQAYIMIMQEGTLSREEQNRILESMDNSAHTLTSLVENILDVSKLERGLLIINKTDFDLMQAVQKAIDTLLPLAQSKNIYLRNEIKPGVIIRADKNLIERVLLNLISNSIKFTDKGGISLACSCSGSICSVTVKDTGIGIKVDELTKIFEKYHQSDSKMKGYGLGLTIVRQIILAHNGEISAESPSEGGAEIKFTLPMEGAL